MPPYDGADVKSADPIALRRRIGYVIQTGGLFPHMTVAANVGVLCSLEGWGAAELRELDNQRNDDTFKLINRSATTGSDAKR